MSMIFQPARFQSTLPARGATKPDIYPVILQKFQSTLPARGATHMERFEADGPAEFQSTLPARGATLPCTVSMGINKEISIHAPREGSDDAMCPARTTARYFNPRSPRGERRMATRTLESARRFQSTLPARGATPPTKVPIRDNKFQSTLPARGATPRPPPQRPPPAISIHAPREGSDLFRNPPITR